MRLGGPRARDEGLRIGTVRRPPRGVKKADYAKLDYYDTWLPELSPGPATVRSGLAAATEKEWQAFAKRYRKEMGSPVASRLIDLLAALSHQTNFSVGCYCEVEARCHRSILSQLLEDRGAAIHDR